jgi:hypothetical protein
MQFRIYEPTDDPKASKAIRIVLPEYNVVIKTWDPDQEELWSLKVWSGSLDKVASYWRMKEVDRELTTEELDRVRSTINDAQRQLDECRIKLRRFK